MARTAVLKSITPGVNSQVVVLVTIKTVINGVTVSEDDVSYCAAAYDEQQAKDFAAARIAEADAADATVAPYQSINSAIAAGQVITLATSPDGA